MEQDFLEGFNDAQRAAVEYCDGPQLVIAGAGSGKTRVLTYKIAYLMRQGYEPWSLLALTFTNKAADEMKERVARIVGEQQARHLWMGTFHSIFLRILRTEHEAIGFQPNFTIYDTADSTSLINSIMKERNLSHKPNTILSRISNKKNQLTTAEDYLSNPDNLIEDKSSGMPSFGKIYQEYSERLHKANAMDFDDILLYTYQLFEQNPKIRKKYAEKFKYVLVDEYQDTNYAQHLIVWQLTKDRQMVCAVGDDAQSIYSFRGANISNILHFKDLYKDNKTFKEFKMFKMERNYRSTQIIVEAANSLIDKNKDRIKKNIFSENERGDCITVSVAYTDEEEGLIVTRQIKRLIQKEHYDYNDFAILYRTNAQSRIFEEVLMKNGIPHRIYGGFSFYQRKEIKDVFGYLRLAVNPNDEEALKRVINYPTRGIGKTTLQKIATVAKDNNVSLWDVLTTPIQYNLQVSNSTINKLEDFKNLIDSFIELARDKNVTDAGKEIISKSGILQDISLDSPSERRSKLENIEELMNSMVNFYNRKLTEGDNNISISDYLSEASLLSDTDMRDKTDEPKVTLMTIHSAKGLEFKTVFIVGLEENLFPNMLAYGSRREMEEERRLFYVALTRAEKHCFLSYAKSRYRYGKMEFCSPSSFLSDIDPQYLNMPNATTKASVTTFAPRRPLFNERDTYGLSRTPQTLQSSQTYRPATTPQAVGPGTWRKVQQTPTTNTSVSSHGNIRIGSTVVHQKFGEGTVEKIEGTGENTKAHIRFANAGVRQLLLKFAKLEVKD